MTLQTPPDALAALVREIETRRGVSLAK